MNIREAFSDSYLRAEDITGPTVVTIKSVEDIVIGDDARIAVAFEEEDKLLPLNKTNALNLADMFGDETDEWLGHQVELYKEKVMFQGRRTSAIRIRSVRAPRRSPEAG